MCYKVHNLENYLIHHGEDTILNLKIAVILLLCVFYMPSLLRADDAQDLSLIAHRIAGRAEIIRDRVAVVYEDSATKTPDLYYFLINSLYDSYGLYSLGDKKNARTKLFLLDTITYDLICAGISTVVELNQAVRELQKSPQAGTLHEFQKLVTQRLGIVSRRGLLESVRFTTTEEQYIAALTQRLSIISRKLDLVMTPQTLLPLLEDYGLIDKKNVIFAFPDSLQVPVTGFIFGVKFNNEHAMVPHVYCESPELSKETVILILANLIAFQEGLGINNNETLESQIHYVLLEMRLCDWLAKNYLQFGLTDIGHLQQWRAWYQGAYERLVEETFAPGYYINLFTLKERPSLQRVEYNWTEISQKNLGVNSSLADDYIFYLIGNGSQMPPNKNLVSFFEAHSEDIVSGIAFDLGSGDGGNSLFLSGISQFSHVIAIDHSQVAINRIKQLPSLEKNASKIRPIRQDIMEYSYPNERTPVLQRASFILLDDVVGYLTGNKRISLLAMLQKSLMQGGYIFIELHLAEGEKYNSFKASEEYSVTEQHIVISENPYQGEQKKQFFTREEFLKELVSAGIAPGDQFELETAIDKQSNGFVIQTIIVRKK